MSTWDDVYYWLPSGMHWPDLQSKPGVILLPETTPIGKSIMFGCIALILRSIFHVVVGLPLANIIGINKSEAGFFNDAIEVGISGLPDAPHNKRLWKFIDTSWRAFFYIVSFSYGLYYIRQKIWYQDFMNCWLYWPMHEYHSDVALHYAVEAGFYWSALAVTVAEYKRKDFVINFAHHLVTLALLGLSWTLNFMRVGSLVLVVHDVADIILEMTKITRYAKWPEITTNIGFGVFAVVWIISRLIVYPTLVYSAVFEGPLLVASKHWPVMVVVLYSMLITLQILHFVWTGIITRSFMDAFINPKAHGHIQDIRSDTEDSDSVLEQEQRRQRQRKRRKAD